jgi:hypothetical protein
MPTFADLVDAVTPITAAYLNNITDYLEQIDGFEHVYATAGGTANAITLTMVPTPASYLEARIISFKTGASANTAAVTVNANGLGAKDLYDQGTSLVSGRLPANFVVWAVYDGTRYQAINIPASTVASTSILGKGYFSNLRAVNNTGSPDSQINITCDYMILLNASNAIHEASSVSVTANIAATGANGRDTGTEAANTWYYLWVISDGTTPAALLSLSSTAPTMPGGYGYKRLVGAIRNDGSSNFLRFNQMGEWTYYRAMKSVLSGGTATSWTSVSIATFVPPSATEASVRLYATVTADTGGVFQASLGHESGTAYASAAYYFSAANLDNIWDTVSTAIPLPTAQTVYYINGSVNGSTYVDVMAFRLNL